MARAYGRVERTRSLRFNLAFAAASETIAYSLARWTDRHAGEMFDGAEPVPTSLFLWHLAEEVEHKSVAFDVWKAVDGTRRRYVLAGATSLVLLGLFTWLATMVMLRDAGRLFRPTSHVRLVVSGGQPGVHDPARPRGVGPQAPPPVAVHRPDHAVDVAAHATTRTAAAFRCGRPASSLDGLAHRAEALPHVLHEELGLLEGGEVAALVRLVPEPEVREAALGPAARGAEDLLGEDRAARPAPRSSVKSMPRKLSQ